MRRRVLVLSALVAATAIAVGSAGFTSAGTDRGVSVSTADDPDAYLSLEYPNEITLDSGETVAFTVTNQFNNPIDITVNYAVETGGSQKDSGSDETTDLGLTEQSTTSVEVTCESDTDYTITFDVEAQSGSGSLSVETTDSRDVDVTCKPTISSDTE